MTDTEALERLMEMFSWSTFDRAFNWVYNEDHTVKDADPELDAFLVKRFPNHDYLPNEKASPTQSS